MECPQCKTDNPADARFCFRCGGALSSAPNEPSTGTLLKIEPGTPDPNAKGTEFKKSPARGPAAGASGRHLRGHLRGRYARA
jgi:hypothetical protein